MVRIAVGLRPPVVGRVASQLLEADARPVRFRTQMSGTRLPLRYRLPVRVHQRTCQARRDCRASRALD